MASSHVINSVSFSSRASGVEPLFIKRALPCNAQNQESYESPPLLLDERSGGGAMVARTTCLLNVTLGSRVRVVLVFNSMDERGLFKRRARAYVRFGPVCT